MKSFLKKVNHRLSDYIDVRFTLIVVIFTVGFYYFNLFYVGITDPKGMLYSSFLANYFDYILWAKVSILHTAHLITETLGTPSYLAPDFTLRGLNRSHVTVAFACVGYGVTGFWLAFIIAQSNNWRKKLLWGIGGSVALWVINCFRVALLLIAYDNRWQVNRFAEHHTMFNIAAYILIFFMMYLYHRSNKKESVAPLPKMTKEHPALVSVPMYQNEGVS